MATLTIALTNTSASQSASINSGSPTTTANNPSFYSIGFRPVNSTVGRAVMQFNLSTIPAGAVITSATISAYFQATNENQTGTVEFAVNRITAAWDDATVTWNTQPAFYANKAGAQDIAGNDTGWKTWDITQLVKGWHEGYITNYGVYLKQTDESGIANSHSDNYYSPTYGAPYLTITYSLIKKVSGVSNISPEIYKTPLFNDANLQGYWRLEADGTDSSGNSNTMANGNAPDYVTGKFGNGAEFTSGNSDYLTLADGSATGLEITGSRTISAWVKCDSLVPAGTIFAHDDATNGWILYQNSWNYQFLVRGLTTSTYVNSATSSGSVGGVMAGAWQHVCAVYDATNNTLKIFTDGYKRSVTASGSSTNSAADFSIGARDKGAAVDLYFDGVIDDVAVWDRALTDTEVRTLYEGGIKRINRLHIKSPELYETSLLNDANLQGYWQLESDGADTSGNAYTLTGTAPTYTMGKFGNGGDFIVASSQYLTIASASSANLRISGSQTWGGWVRIKSDATMCLMGIRANSITTARMLIRSSVTKSFAFRLDGLTPNELYSTVDTEIGNWYHIVGRYDSSGNTLAVFVNGVKTSVSVSGSLTALTEDFSIGRDGAHTANYFDGMIDDCFVMDRAMSDAEITALYTAEIKKISGIEN